MPEPSAESTTYSFDNRANGYFQGNDMMITRDRDEREITVNSKDGMWAVEVKSHHWPSFSKDEKVKCASRNVGEREDELARDRAQQWFWDQVEMIGENFDFDDATTYSAGRSSGWCCLATTRDWESSNPGQPIEDEAQRVGEWIEWAFDVDDLRRAAEAHADELILEANQEVQIELSKFTDYVGAEVVPNAASGEHEAFTVTKLTLDNGHPMLVLDSEEEVEPFELAIVKTAEGDSRECPNCGRAFRDGLASIAHFHSGCVLAALVGVVSDRSEVEIDETRVAKIDSDLFWSKMGRVVDEIEEEVKVV